MKNKIVLGLMSGTSADGLSISAVRPSPFKITAFKTYPYSPALQNKLLNAYKASARDLSRLNFELGKLYAEKTKLFLKQFKINRKDIAGAGSHGQTVYHGPKDCTPNTLQIGESSFLAEMLGAPVVSDFRVKDMALGGEGAPLIPFFDEYVWGGGAPKILVNIGGVSNLSVVGKTIKTFGFDCGPGNTLMDLICQRVFKMPFDTNGELAARGTVDMQKANALLKHPFFSRKPPKSLDKNEFGADYIAHYFPAPTQKNAANLLATLNYLTAASIARAAAQFVAKNAQKELIVSGGGAYNKTLMRHLRELLPGLTVTTTLAYGIDEQAKESAAFALMAWFALQGKSNHCARATGARKNTILGKITL